jgi:hypothetical protein
MVLDMLLFDLREVCTLVGASFDTLDKKRLSKFVPVSDEIITVRICNANFKRKTSGMTGSGLK